MTSERDLFAAYRHPAGYSAQCSCGGWIDAPAEADVQKAIDIHNLSTEHVQWRKEQEAVESLRRRVTVHICPCHGEKE